MQPRAITGDKSVRYDYPIVYVRAPRRGDKENTHWPDVNNPVAIEPGSGPMSSTTGTNDIVGTVHWVDVPPAVHECRHEGNCGNAN